jgi:hypothetical protein
VAVRTREIYRGANGDRWLLARDPDTGRVFVRHEPNLPSGGQGADIEIGAFLIAAGNGPEKQELLRLIGTKPLPTSKIPAPRSPIKEGSWTDANSSREALLSIGPGPALAKL